MDVLFATHNRDKAREVLALLSDLPFHYLTLNDFPHFPQVDETGATIEDNAIIKARAGFDRTGLLTFADDTGLFVDALGGRPGVSSARFAGDNVTYRDNNLKLLAELKGVPSVDRTARFRCVVALVGPTSLLAPLEQDDESIHIQRTDAVAEILVTGELEGLILDQLRGAGGFGYDPLFYVPEQDCTLAQLSLEGKNRISHRSRAMRKLRSLLAQIQRGHAG